MAIYYINVYGNETDVLAKAVEATLKLVQISVTHQGAIAVHKKDQVSRSVIWKEAIGESATKSLANGQAVIGG